MPPALIFVVALVLVMAVLLVVAWRKERTRTEELRRVAATAGFVFQAKGDLAALRALGAVPLFERGHSRRVRNLMTGRIGDEQLAVFDYRYSVGSGKSQRTRTQTVVLLHSAGRLLPELQMFPENPVTRLAEKFGFQDIDIDSSPEFSRRYVVRGKDEHAIRAALAARATSYFAAHEGWTVEARSGTVAIYREDRRPKPQDLRAFIEEACTAARNL
jgi:hypothetical protein